MRLTAIGSGAEVLSQMRGGCMSNFSVVLSKLMDQKGLESKDVISYTGINRSTFFKIRNGTRNPSGIEMIEKIAIALRLDEEDRTMLFEAYEIDQIGPYKYYGMKAVEKFFKAEGRLSEMPAMTIKIPQFPIDKTMQVFRDSTEITSLVHGMLNEKSAQIMIMENGMSDVYINGIAQASAANKDTEFHHIFLMDSTETVGINHQLYNIECFCNVVEIINRTSRYYPRYYYSPVAAFANKRQPTNFILNDRFLLTYSDGMKMAILYRDPDVLELYREIFDEARGKSVCFVEAMGQAGFTQEFVLSTLLEDTDDIVYSFCPEPCCPLAVEGNEEWIQQYISDNFPGKEAFVHEYILYAKRFRDVVKENADRWHVICASNALKQFAKTGYINEFPRDRVSEFPKEFRSAMLRLWRIKAEEYNVKSVKGRMIPDTSSICAFVSRRKAILTFMNEQTGLNIHIGVSEPSIVGFIYGYLEKIEREDVMGREEYRAFINGLIAELGEKGND